MTELGIIPESLDLAKRMVNFKKYVLDDEGLYEKHIDEGKKVPKEDIMMVIIFSTTILSLSSRNISQKTQ